MMAQLINRRQVKLASRQLLKQATVSATAMIALYFSLQIILNLLGSLSGRANIPVLGTFFSILTMFMDVVLSAGFVLYCMAIRRGEHAEYATLFDGFSMVGKVMGLYFLETFFIAMWATLFLVPGIIAGYRYRFAIYNLLENPDLTIFQALELSKRQTMGYKMQCFLLDFSYLGWLVLAGLPTYLVNLSYTMTSFGAEMTPFFLMLSEFPNEAAVLVCGLWNMVASLFYYGSLTCSDLEYFEIAKTTSGLTPFSEIPPSIPTDTF